MGILANSASVSMTSSGSDATKTGYVVGEQVVLTVNPAGESYAWAMSMPASSAPARSMPNATDTARVIFTPDVAGEYVVVCDVDGTVYRLLLSVTMRATTTLAQSLRFSPVPDASVAAPSGGRALYFSSDQNALVVKAPDGSLATVDLTAVP